MADAAEHPNVTLVRDNFIKITTGEIASAMQDWEVGARYHAFDANGVESTEIHAVDEVRRTGQQLLEHHENEIVDIRAVGSELVVLQLRVTAVSHSQREMEAEYLIVLNVRDGKIHWACDFIDNSIQAFMDEAWS